MSGSLTTPPPPPSGLPPRPRPRKLNRKPLLLGIAIIAIVLGTMFYALVSVQDAGVRSASTKRPDDVGGSAATDKVLANAPRGPVIPALLSEVIPPPSAPPPPSPAAESLPIQPPPPADTQIARDARKAAWMEYYRQKQQVADEHATALRAALVADTPAGAQQTAPSGQPGSQAGGGLQGSLGGDSGGGSSADATAGAGMGGGGMGGMGMGGRQPQPRGLYDQAGASPETDYLRNPLTSPKSIYELKAGDVIGGVMLSGLTSESHGIVRAQSTTPVYDHATGMHILIPQGSQLVGVYQTGGAAGQQRVEVAWERIIFPAPCDQSLDLGMMPGADESGFSGFHDITETHFWEQAKALLLASVFSAGIQLSQPQQSSFNGSYSSSQVIAGALGQQLGEWGMEQSRQTLAIPPVQKIRNGYPFAIMATKDIAFSHPWQPGMPGHPETCKPESVIDAAF